MVRALLVSLLFSTLALAQEDAGTGVLTKAPTLLQQVEPVFPPELHRRRRGRHGDPRGGHRARRQGDGRAGVEERGRRLRRLGAGRGAPVRLQPRRDRRRARRGAHLVLVGVPLPAQGGGGAAARRGDEGQLHRRGGGARHARSRRRRAGGGGRPRDGHRRRRPLRVHRSARGHLPRGGGRLRVPALRGERDLHRRQAHRGEVLHPQEALRRLRDGGARPQGAQGGGPGHPLAGGDQAHPRHQRRRLPGGAEPARRGARAVRHRAADRPRRQVVGHAHLRGRGAGAAALPLRRALLDLQRGPAGEHQLPGGQLQRRLRAQHRRARQREVAHALARRASTATSTSTWWTPRASVEGPINENWSFSISGAAQLHRRRPPRGAQPHSRRAGRGQLHPRAALLRLPGAPRVPAEERQGALLRQLLRLVRRAGAGAAQPVHRSRGARHLRHQHPLQPAALRPRPQASRRPRLPHPHLVRARRAELLGGRATSSRGASSTRCARATPSPADPRDQRRAERGPRSRRDALLDRGAVTAAAQAQPGPRSVPVARR